MRTLDVEAVQAFVLVADLKSFTRTAEAMDITQSALSLKIEGPFRNRRPSPLAQ
jgi:DNA-binding transcriptional LysR family regulator